MNVTDSSLFFRRKSGQVLQASHLRQPHRPQVVHGLEDGDRGRGAEDDEEEEGLDVVGLDQPIHQGEPRALLSVNNSENPSSRFGEPPLLSTRL